MKKLFSFAFIGLMSVGFSACDPEILITEKNCDLNPDSFFVGVTEGKDSYELQYSKKLKALLLLNEDTCEVVSSYSFMSAQQQEAFEKVDAKTSDGKIIALTGEITSPHTIKEWMDSQTESKQIDATYMATEYSMAIIELQEDHSAPIELKVVTAMSSDHDDQKLNRGRKVISTDVNQDHFVYIQTMVHSHKDAPKDYIADLTVKTTDDRTITGRNLIEQLDATELANIDADLALGKDPLIQAFALSEINRVLIMAKSLSKVLIFNTESREFELSVDLGLGEKVLSPNRTSVVLAKSRKILDLSTGTVLDIKL